MTRFGAWTRGLVGGKAEGSEPPPVLPASFAEDQNEFALAMYSQLRQAAGNLFFSPFSIRTALGMTLAGARGETEAQMRETLRLSSSNENLYDGFARIIHRLKAAGGGRYEMTVANALWCHGGVPPRHEFVDLISRHYRGGVNVVDFDRDAEAARVRINHWVDRETRHRIKGLIPPGSLDANTRLVVVNACYFKGTWELPFRRTCTRDEPFHVEGGGTVHVPLMYQRLTVQYMQGTGYQMVDLSYRGGDLSMLVLLPDQRDGLQELERTISARWLSDCVTLMEPCRVQLSLPRFKLASGNVNLRAELVTLGMPLAFTPLQADFSGINGCKPPDEESLFMSDAFHRAVVETNEEDTEAAAASAFGLARFDKEDPPAVFRADHPFFFAIRDSQSGAILFLGRMAVPMPQN